MTKQGSIVHKLVAILTHNHFHRGVLLGSIVAGVVGVSIGAVLLTWHIKNAPPTQTPTVQTAHTNVPKDNRTPIKKGQLPIFVYFGNTNDTTGTTTCDKVWPVRRTIKQGDDILQSSIAELLQGVTDKEKNSGYVTAIPNDTIIHDIAFASSTATVAYSGSLRDMNKSCARTQAFAQITSTLLQLPQVHKVSMRYTE